MYKISIPIMLRSVIKYGKQAYLSELKRARAERVFLAIDCVPNGQDERRTTVREVTDAVCFFHENGFEVGVWYWAFMREHSGYTHITAFDGERSALEICPLEPEFSKDCAGFIREIAQTGTDIILFDDDYRLGFLDSGFGCCCPHHLKEISERFGEPVVREGLYERLFIGGKNRLRDIWLDVMGETLLDFADKMRAAVDEVNPDIRIGLCSCMSTWDIDGVDSYTIASRLAGNTKPLLRLIGAPYWVENRSWGNRLQDVIETERMQLSWKHVREIEIIAEGDVYPRPRTAVPANFLEGFDMAMRADGRLDGILKYMIDYTCAPTYETGYVDRHLKNAGIYREISEYFFGKEAVGVRVYESMSKLRDAEFTAEDIADRHHIENMFFSLAARLLACNTIPTVYDGKGITGIAFGENVKCVPDTALGRGIILDIRAAQILMKHGVDVGISSIGEKKFCPQEYHPEQDLICPAGYAAYPVVLNNRARVLSSYTDKAQTGIPAAFIYENGMQQRFLVFTVDAFEVNSFKEALSQNNERFLRSYARAKQITDMIPWLSGGNKLPAVCAENPDLYMLCKRDDSALAVGLWNFFADEVISPVIKLDKKYASVKYFGTCRGELEDDTVRLNGDIPPFGFAGFEVR